MINTPRLFVYDDLLFLFSFYNINKILNDRAYITFYELYDIFTLLQNIFTKYEDVTCYYIFNCIKYKCYLNINPININPININPININPTP